MHFEEGNIYHVYNMGNNSAKIFFSNDNYLFFLQKIRKEIKPICEILAYCLMPNHFHLMIMATSKSCEKNKQGFQFLSRKLRTILSSYSQAINKQNNTSGSLFRQKTKAKNLYEFFTYPTIKEDYTRTCFFYIQNNPVKANLVKSATEWEYSSFLDFCDLRNGTLCNKKTCVGNSWIRKRKFGNTYK
jgi:putative transposase